jgi:hypothetical protein
MELGRLSLTLTITGLAVVMLASGLIWLLLYEPVAIADALERGDMSLAVEALGRALVSTLQALVRYI